MGKTVEQNAGHPVQYVGSFERDQAERQRFQRFLRAAEIAVAVGISVSAVVLALNFYADARAAVHQQAVQKWSTEITGQLRGETPLHPNQRSFNNVRVVPSGATYDELLAKQKTGEPISITIFVNPQQPKIPAHIRQETIVTKAVIDDSKPELETAAFLCEPLKDSLIQTPNEPLDEQAICLIPLDNLKSVRK